MALPISGWHNRSMAVFIIVGVSTPAVLNRRIEEQIPQKDRYKLSDDSCLISYVGTTQQLHEKLDIASGNVGTAVVLAVANYWGRANPDVWEWLKLHLSTNS